MSFQGVTRTRVTAVAVASAGLAVSTFVGGTVAAAAAWLLVSVVIVWGYVTRLADPNPLLSRAVRLTHGSLLEYAERLRVSLAALGAYTVGYPAAARFAADAGRALAVAGPEPCSPRSSASSPTPPRPSPSRRESRWRSPTACSSGTIWSPASSSRRSSCFCSGPSGWPPGPPPPPG